MYKDYVKKAVKWAVAGLGAALAAAGIVSMEGWEAVMTEPLQDGIAGVGALVVGGLVAKVYDWMAKAMSDMWSEPVGPDA